MQTTFSKISNSILKYFIIFSVCFLWLNFYTDKIIVTIITAFGISILLCFVINYIGNKKHIKDNITINENNQINNYALQLLCYSENEIMDYFSKLLSIHHPKVFGDHFEWKDIVVYPYFNTKYLTNDIVYKMLKKDKKIIIFCCEIDKNCDIQNRLDMDIKIYDIHSLYRIMKKYDVYPDIIYTTKQSKRTFHTIKNFVLSKNNTKHYLWSAIVLTLTSFIVPYSVYYILMASLLYIMAFITHFRKSVAETSDDI